MADMPRLDSSNHHHHVLLLLLQRPSKGLHLPHLLLDEDLCQRHRLFSNSNLDLLRQRLRGRDLPLPLIRNKQLP